MVANSRPAASPFAQHTTRYEQWFDRYPWVYGAELQAVRELLPAGPGLEVGVGSGRFAAPLGIASGVDPSLAMLALARQRGIRAVGGVAEQLPFPAASFAFVLMVTTICFVKDLAQALGEAHRVLTRNGACLLGLIDRHSTLGQQYLQKQGESLFYREAVFYGVDEVIAHLGQAGFHDFSCRQTLYSGLAAITAAEPVRAGYGQGSFVVVRGQKD